MKAELQHESSSMHLIDRIIQLDKPIDENHLLVAVKKEVLGKDLYTPLGIDEPDGFCTCNIPKIVARKSYLVGIQLDRSTGNPGSPAECDGLVSLLHAHTGASTGKGDFLCRQGDRNEKNAG